MATFPSDIEIAQNATMLHIKEIAKKINIEEDDLEYYGKYKAKLPLKLQHEHPKGKLILVSAMSPTKYGEGKTTMSIGLTDGLNYIGKKAIAVLREPSLGPVFGLKGGAAGGGYGGDLFGLHCAVAAGWRCRNGHAAPVPPSAAGLGQGLAQRARQSDGLVHGAGRSGVGHGPASACRTRQDGGAARQCCVAGGAVHHRRRAGACQHGGGAGPAGARRLEWRVAGGPVQAGAAPAAGLRHGQGRTGSGPAPERCGDHRDDHGRRTAQRQQRLAAGRALRGRYGTHRTHHPAHHRACVRQLHAGGQLDELKHWKFLLLK